MQHFVFQVCSMHFVDGRPSKENPAPSVHMGYQSGAPTPGRRPLVRRSLDLNTPDPEDTIDSGKIDQQCCDDNNIYTATPITCSSVNEIMDCCEEQCDAICCFKYPEQCKNAKKTTCEMSTQTIDLISLDHSYFYSHKTKDAAVQHNSSEFSIECISTDSDSVFYTGLSFTILMTLISCLTKFGHSLPFRLKVPDQILLVLVRLRLALTFRDIGRRFDISHQLASRIFNTWIDIMSTHLSLCICWLPRETIRRTMPLSFRLSFPNTTCIIDCSEIFIQRAFSLKARAQTWSTYKSHNTAKFLIAIAPNGFIMYVSPLYGGRASDNYITKNCGLLEYLLPGDEVMADRGFTIGEELCSRRVKLNIPAFMKGRDQLSEEDTINTRRIAAERIHVERAIMRIKSYRLLNTKLGIKSLKNANRTLCVISALCNMKNALIKDKDNAD